MNFSQLCDKSNTSTENFQFEINHKYNCTSCNYQSANTELLLYLTVYICENLQKRKICRILNLWKNWLRISLKNGGLFLVYVMDAKKLAIYEKNRRLYDMAIVWWWKSSIIIFWEIWVIIMISPSRVEFQDSHWDYKMLSYEYYTFYSVVFHIGNTTNLGHYFCWMKLRNTGLWLIANDTSITHYKSLPNLLRNPF